MRRKRIHVVVSFPEPLPVAADALGRTFDVKIARIDGRITLPHSDDGDDEWPRLRVQVPESNPIHAMVSDIADWGNQFGDSWELHGALVSFLVAPGIHPRDSAEVAQFTEAFAPWFLSARRWVLAKLGTPANGSRRSHRAVVHGVLDGNHWGTGGGTTVVITPGLRGATAAELDMAFQHASAGDALPIEHDLLLEAHTALFSFDRRRAVVDAATAAEVVLAKWIRRHLEQHGLAEEQGLALVQQANGIADLYRLAGDLGLSLTVSRNSVLDRIARPRNSAVHSGQEPSEEAARRAFTCAQAIVDEVAPLRLP